MKSRRFQLVIPQDAFAVMQRMQAHYGGSLSSVVRRGVRMLETLADARENGCNVCVLPPAVEAPAGAVVLKEPDGAIALKEAES